MHLMLPLFSMRDARSLMTILSKAPLYLAAKSLEPIVAVVSSALPIPISALVPSKKNLDILWEDVAKNFLKEVGFSESYNYSFISERDTEIFKYDEKEIVELENSLSSDFQYLRPSLIPNLFKSRSIVPLAQ